MHSAALRIGGCDGRVLEPQQECTQKILSNFALIAFIPSDYNDEIYMI